jgi:hypothetical protein
MSIVPKAFFGWLVLMMLLSYILTWENISKLHQNDLWPDSSERQWLPDGRHHQSWFIVLTNDTIFFYDLAVGKIIIFALMVAVSTACWKWAFNYEYLYTGLLSFFIFVGYFAWVAFWLRFFAPIPVIRM